MLKIFVLLISVAAMAAQTSVSAQESLSIPYEVRAQFRESGCETVTLREAARTDMGRQTIYVASCSGVEIYLMAVKCRGTSCQTLR